MKRLKVGVAENDDCGAIINVKRMRAILAAVRGASGRGAKILCGGERLTDAVHKEGCVIAPTVLENIDPSDPASCEELFGPAVACTSSRKARTGIATICTSCCRTSNSQASETTRSSPLGKNNVDRGADQLKIS